MWLVNNIWYIKRSISPLIEKYCFFSSGCGTWFCGTHPNYFGRQKIVEVEKRTHKAATLQNLCIRKVRELIMNTSRVVLKEDGLVVSVPYSPIVFGGELLRLMENFHRLPANVKFDCIFDHKEVYYHCEHIGQYEAPGHKFSLRIMNSFLMFIHLYDFNFFCNVMKGITFLMENKRHVNGWYFNTQMGHDLLRNERGHFRFYSNWKFNTFIMTSVKTYEQFKSLLKLSAPPISENDDLQEPLHEPGPSYPAADIEENDELSDDMDLPDLE